ncbi:MAG: HAMP domain-containing histidine kinase, partial [Elusimicrobia bacterium]|nr:HAMP domain-containing histidine kinase [Elusimicrobiota bacterium]
MALVPTLGLDYNKYTMLNWFKRGSGRSDFYLKLAHDLRNPLSCIDGYSQLLLKSSGTASKDQEEDALKRISFCSQQALGLLEELMDDEAIRKGDFRLNPAPVLLENLLRQVVQGFEIVCQTKGISLQLQPLDGRTLIVADSKRVMQVLFNLMSNAVRHTPKKGSIIVSLDMEQDYARICVVDTGEGIAPKEQKKIFRKFYRSGKNSGGLGLGLNICREIVSQHNGEIGVASEGIGKGSCFYFTLPLAPVGVLQDAAGKPWDWFRMAGLATTASLLVSLFAMEQYQDKPQILSPKNRPMLAAVSSTHDSSKADGTSISKRAFSERVEISVPAVNLSSPPSKSSS